MIENEIRAERGGATKAQRAIVRELNAIVHCRNLYRIADGARVVNAHIRTFCVSTPIVALELLQSGNDCLFRNGVFKDGYGNIVNL